MNESKIPVRSGNGLGLGFNELAARRATRHPFFNFEGIAS